MTTTPPPPMQRAPREKLLDYAQLCEVRANELDRQTRKKEAEVFREIAEHFRQLSRAPEETNRTTTQSAIIKK